MPTSVEISKTTFAAGELSPELRVRSDLAKQQTGLWFLENMVVLLEGGVTRRPGTQMVLQLTPGHAYVGIPFRFSGSGSNAYLIVIGNGVAQFVLGNSVVVIGGGNNNPYTVPVPYTDADLGGAGARMPGVPNLRWASSGNVVFLFCDGHPPQTLTRNADNSWTLAPYISAPAVAIPQGGCLAPVDTENFDVAETIAVTLASGTNAQTPGATVTLSASAAFAGAGATVPNGFQAGHVGSVWRLDESDLSLVPEWAADETITVSTQALPAASGNFGDMTNLGNAFDGNTNTAAIENGVTHCYIGQSWGTAQSIYQATLNQLGFANFLNSNASGGTIYLYGKNGAPANGTDGTLLGSVNYSGTGINAQFTITSNNPIATFDHIWLYITENSSSPTNFAVNEITWKQFSSSSNAVYRRFNGNVYQALNSGNAGATAPVHTSGAVLSGQGGVDWLYVHRDRGFVLITAVTSPTQATATVLEAIPLSCLIEATYHWWPSAWDGIKGWPDRVQVQRNSLQVARQGKGWLTQPGTFNNYDITDPTNAQSAIAFQLISPTGSLAWIEIFQGGLYLGAHTRDENWVLVGQDILSPITIENLSPYVSGSEGVAPQIPALAEGGLICINRARDRVFLMNLAYSYFMPQYATEELTLTARHILKRADNNGGALGISHQQDPNRINWLWCKSGEVIANTLMTKQQINGWARCPQHAPTSSQVNWIATIPSSDEGISWTYFITTRTINGQVAQFVELLQPFFQPANFANPDASGAWFLDCALQYQGPPVKTIGGLNHLIGQQVGVHADGCTYLNPDGSLPVVNASGQITLSRPTQNAVVGLPIAYRARLLPLDIETPHGTDAGARQKANHLFLRVVNSAGGAIAVNPDEGGIPENLEEPGTLTYGQPIPLRNGVLRTPGLDVPLADQTIVEITGALTPQGIECDTMPFTLIGVDPDVVVTEQT